MGIWKTLTRPKAVGLFIDGDVLYSKRYANHPDYRLLVTPEEQRAYLTPTPIPLEKARVFFDAEVVGQRQGAVAVEVGPFIPILPVNLGKKKIYWVSVHTADNTVYRGWSNEAAAAQRLVRRTQKLINAANG